MKLKIEGEARQDKEKDEEKDEEKEEWYGKKQQKRK